MMMGSKSIWGWGGAVIAALSLFPTTALSSGPQPDLRKTFWAEPDVYVVETADGLTSISLTLPNSDVPTGAYAVWGDHILAGGLHGGHLFSISTGALLHSFDDPTASTGEGVYSVGLYENVVAIGDPGEASGEMWNVGAVHLFDGTTGNLLRTLNNPTPEAEELFGQSISVYGNHVLVGAPGALIPAEGGGFSPTGAAYVFDVGTGQLLWTLNKPTPSPLGFERFGVSVCLWENQALIGAAGAAYLFDAATGGLSRALNDPIVRSSQYFGAPAAIRGAHICVGAGDPWGAVGSGGAYLINEADASLERIYFDPTPADGDRMGEKIKFTEHYVLVWGGEADEDHGKIYAYEIPPEPSSPARINQVLLGEAAPTFADDLNGDHVIDIADLLFAQLNG